MSDIERWAASRDARFDLIDAIDAYARASGDLAVLHHRRGHSAHDNFAGVEEVKQTDINNAERSVDLTRNWMTELIGQMFTAAASAAAGSVTVALCLMCGGTGFDMSDGGPEGIPTRVTCECCRGVGVSRLEVQRAIAAAEEKVGIG